MTIQERLAKIRFFKVTPDLSGLKKSEQEALAHCVQAARITTDIYLEQVAHGNTEIYESLKRRSDQEGIDLLRYFNLHGTPWDAYDHDKPFVPGVGEKPKFGSFYPADLTKEEWDAWLAAHPEDREQFESNYTAIKRRGGRLIAVPYSEEYSVQLVEAAKQLKAGQSASFTHSE